MNALNSRFDTAALSATLPLDIILSMIPSLPRAALDRLTERAIDRLDEMDGDLDIEPNGDELDGHMGEDDFRPHSADWLAYAGDPQDAEEDDPAECDARDDGCGPITAWRGVLWGYEGDIAG